MDRANLEVELLDLVNDGGHDAALGELNDMQLALIGGGAGGEVSFS